MSGTIKHRHQTVIASSGADVDKNEWNDSLVAAGGTEGQVMQRDSSQPDGWKFANVTTFAAMATRSVADGRQGLFVPTDGYSIGRDNGASFDTFGPVFPFAPVTDPGTWINQGTSTIASAKDAVTITGGATVSAANLVLRVQAHAAPKQYTAYVRGTLLSKTASGGHNGYGLAFVESGTSKIHFHGIYMNASGQLVSRVTRYTSATVFSSDYQILVLGNSFNWLRLEDNGVNMISSLSENGQDWVQIHTIARNNFFTTGPDQVGFAVSTENTTTPNFAPIMTVLSFKAV